MNALRLALAGAIAGAVCAATVHADDSLEQPASVQKTTFSEYKYNNYYAQDETTASPSDQPPAAAAAAPACSSCGSPSCNSCNSCNSCCDDGCFMGDALTLWGHLDPCCKLDKPCLLSDHTPCLKECHKINIAGWLNQSFTWNPQMPSDRFNGPVTWTDRANEYQVNQAYIYAERPTDTKGCGWDFGFRADLLFGTDYRFNTESNLETRRQFQFPKNFARDRFYGLDYLQFYGEVAYNDLKVKIGHFLSPVGYEVIPTTGNFFPTLPYIFQYGEPFTHTGALATYKLNDTAYFGSGVIRGWDNFGNNNPNLGYLGTYTKTFEDKSSYATVFIWSNEPNQLNTFNSSLGPGTSNSHSSRFIWTHAYTKPLTEKLNYVFQFDYAQQVQAMTDGRTARWYGWNQYLFYKVSDCWTWGTRFDFWRDEEGFRMGGFLGTNSVGSTRGLSTFRNSYAGNNLEWSVGANYRPNANMIIRPAIRYDLFVGNNGWGPAQVAFNSSAAAPTPLKPYDNGQHDWQILIGFDWITLF